MKTRSLVLAALAVFALAPAASAQTVTCTCGWTGSSATTDGRNSPWSLHVAANRPAKR